MSFTINLDSQENMTNAELFTEPLRGVLGGRNFTVIQVGLDPLNNQNKAIYDTWQRALVGILLFTVALPYTIIAAAILVTPPIYTAVAAYFAASEIKGDDLEEIVKILDEELNKSVREDEKVKTT